MSLTIWDRVPAVRPEFDDEPMACPSRLYLRAVRDRAAYSLGCTLDAEHTGAGLDNRHGQGLARWTSAEAADSLAECRAAAGPLCTDCETRPQHIGGRCWICAADELVRDNIETETESVA